jgi:hypothetical protein
MNPKYSLKVIKQGQTQKVYVVSPGAGMQGQGVNVPVSDATRLQLTDIVTLTAPEKLQMKRVGKDLQIALPGGDVDAPDIVVKDYYLANDVTLQGQNLAGEWKVYSAANLPDMAAAASPERASAKAVAMADASAGLGGSTMAALAVGGIALFAGHKGGGGDAAAPSATPSSEPLTVIASYAGSAGTSAAPTAQNYTEAGAPLVTVPGVSGSDVLSAMNAVVAARASTDVDTAPELAAIQTSLAASFQKILNYVGGTTTAPDTTDFANVGIKLADASGTGKTLALLNSAIAKFASTSSVNTYSGLKKLATTANDVMLLNQGGNASQSDANLIAGLNALLGSSAVNSSNIASIKSTIASTATHDGTAVDTLAELQGLVSLQVIKLYATSNGTSTAPSVADYAGVGIKVFASLTDQTPGGRQELSTTSSNAALGNGSFITAINTAVVKRFLGNEL